MSAPDDKKGSTTAELTVTEVKAQLPGPEKEITAVFRFNIAWVREALAAVNIAVEDLSDPGECKAALITYYQGPSTAESEVDVAEARRQEAEEVGESKAEATKALRPEVEEADASSRRALWVRGALLKNAPFPHKTAGLNWKANSTTGLGLMAGSPGSLMGLIGKAWPDRVAMLRCNQDHIFAACDDAAG